MKTLNEQIERLRELIRKCYGAVAGKNGTVPEVEERNMENLPAAIGSIKSASEVERVKIYGSLRFYPLYDANVVNPHAELLDTTGVTSLSALCYAYHGMTKCDVSKWDTSNVTNMNDMFNNAISIKTLDLTSFDASKCVGWWGTLAALTACESLVGGRSYEDVVNNNITILKGKSTSDPNFIIRGLTNIDKASIRALINGLADVSEKGGKTLSLGEDSAVILSKLSVYDIAEATKKGWTIV